jgi:hypothetical protein
MVVASVALFLAIGGISYAAVKIGTHNIRDGAVTKAKLHANAVVSQKVRDGSLRRKDLVFAVQSPPGFTSSSGRMKAARSMSTVSRSGRAPTAAAAAPSRRFSPARRVDSRS